MERPKSRREVGIGFLDFRTHVEGALGTEFPQVWRPLCARNGIGPGAADVDDRRFDRLLSDFSRRDPLCGLLARSWRIRTESIHSMELADR